MKKIPLTQGKFALVDDSDFKRVSKYKWYFGHGYAMRDVRVFGNWRKDFRIYMHRFLLGLNGVGICDHINRDGLDNRRSNLRVVSKSQNGMNRGRQNNNTSGHKGVTWNKKRLKWQAQIKINQKNIVLGCFSDIESAVKARRKGELTYHSI